MIEANAEIYEKRAIELVQASNEERIVISSFLKTRAALQNAGDPMTGGQKTAALGLLTAAKTERETAVTALDVVFNATTPL